MEIENSAQNIPCPLNSAKVLFCNLQWNVTYPDLSYYSGPSEGLFHRCSSITVTCVCVCVWPPLLSLQYMPAAAAAPMQGTYIPQYTAVPASAITVEVRTHTTCCLLWLFHMAFTLSTPAYRGLYRANLKALSHRAECIFGQICASVFKIQSNCEM